MSLRALQYVSPACTQEVSGRRLPAGRASVPGSQERDTRQTLHSSSGYSGLLPKKPRPALFVVGSEVSREY
jgi:hypothetical protein